MGGATGTGLLPLIFFSPPFPLGFFFLVLPAFLQISRATPQRNRTHMHTRTCSAHSTMQGTPWGTVAPCLPFFLPFLALSPLVWYVGTSEKENGEIWAVSVLRTACTCVCGCKGSALLVVSGAFLRFMVGLFLRVSETPNPLKIFIYVVYNGLVFEK